MESRTLPTVTIGIPAYNEANTITLLLDSLLQQKGRFLLKKIIILSDGSTDETDEKVRSYTALYPHIALLSDGRRLGKAQRLNQLYTMNTNEFLIVFDGDVVLFDEMVIEKLLRKFINEHVVMVGGNVIPAEQTTLTEKLISTWQELWYEIQKDIHFGHTIHNVYGRIIALRREFAASIRFPEGTISEPQYLYFTVRQRGLKFMFAKDASVFYSLPTTIADYAKQYNRHIGEMQKNAKTFGEWIYLDAPVKRKYKVSGLFRMLIRKPVSTFLAIGFHLWFVKTSDKKPAIEKPGIWEVVPSTKRRMRLGL